MAKDYKPNQSQGGHKTPVFNGLIPYLLIFVVGLGVGLINPFQKIGKGKEALVALTEEPNSVDASSPDVEDASISTPQFDFYQILPEMKVDVGGEKAMAASSPVESLPREPEVESKLVSANESESQQYRLQVGAFKTPEEALRVKVELAFLGLESSIDKLQEKSGSSVLHRVKLGPYRTVRDVQKVAETLKRHGFVVVKIAEEGSKPL